MEYVDGVNLHDIIKNNDILPFEVSINIIKQIAEGLSYAHSREVIHRSLQPENIIISKDKKVKIINFGISKAIANTWLTMTGTTVSNVEYMSPEQAEGEIIDYRSDIYSLGIIMYELFTGQVPFKREKQTILQLAMKHINAIPELPSKINKELPSWIEDIIIKCIEKKPSNRFQNLNDIIKAFESKDDTKKKLDLFISSKVEDEKDNIEMKELEYFLYSDNKDSVQDEEIKSDTIQNVEITNNLIEEEKIEIDKNQKEVNELKDNNSNIDQVTITKEKNENQKNQIKLFLSILIILEIIIISIILFIYLNG
jgi:serine/threonine-protein kinase